MGYIGLIVLVIAPFYIYRSARENGHNPWLWTLLAIGAGVGLQIILPFLIGMLLVALMTGAGRLPSDMDESMRNYSFFIGMLSLALSLTAFLLISQYVSQVKKKSSDIDSAPPGTAKI